MTHSGGIIKKKQQIIKLPLEVYLCSEKYTHIYIEEI